MKRLFTSLFCLLMFVVSLSAQQDTTVYSNPEIAASFPGGQEGLIQFLSQNMNYPSIAQGDGVQGRVLVSFIVNVDGSTSDATIFRSIPSTYTPDPKLSKKKNEQRAQRYDEAVASLNREALRIISIMPKWVPAKFDGKPVRMKYTLPINFRLQ